MVRSLQVIRGKEQQHECDSRECYKDDQYETRHDVLLAYWTSSRSPAAVEEMDHQENDRKDKQKVNECGCDMKDDERPNPREEQNKCEAKKQKSHKRFLIYHNITGG